MAEEDTMTISEAAKRVGKAENTIRNYIKAGKLFASQNNGHLEVDPDELLRVFEVSSPDLNVTSTLQQQIEGQKRQLQEKETQIAKLHHLITQMHQDSSQTQQQQNAIIMQLSRQLEHQTQLLEHHKTPFWKRWFRSSNRWSKPRQGQDSQPPHGVI